MAAWDVSIKVLDVSEKRVSVTATRVEGDEISVFRVLDAIIETQEQKAAVLDNLWDQHLAYEQSQIAIENFMGGLELTAKNNLEARE